ncbi:MAG: hypothetical protein WBL05_05645 [Brooklawnia sp.]|uniref:hypothetical protein n=1 Tax=Brooklawnia sp. TaxID=2699740 RepID=UPI003C762C6E
MEWLEISVPGPGRLLLRRTDRRFWQLSTTLVDYDFNTAGEFTGRDLDIIVRQVATLASGKEKAAHIVLQASWGQSVIMAADEATELLPPLIDGVARAKAAAAERLSN